MERKLSDFLYAADNGSIVGGKLTYDGGEITKDDTVPFPLSAMDGTDYSVPFSVVGFGMEEYCDEVGNAPMITIKSNNIIPMDRKSIIRTFRNFGRVEITDDGYVFIHMGNNGKNVAILNNTEISINNLTRYLTEFKCVIDTKDAEIGSMIFDFNTYHIRMTRETDCVRIITENAQNSYVYTNIPVGKTQIAIERTSDSNIYHRCAGDTIANLLFTVGEVVRRVPCKYDDRIDENKIYAVMEVTNEDNVINTNVNTYDEEFPQYIDALYYGIDTKLFGTTLPDNLYRLNHITIYLGKDLFKNTFPIFVNPQYGIYYDSLHRQIYVTNVLPKSIAYNTDRFILDGNVGADNDIEIKINKCHYNREENNTIYKFTIVDTEDCETFHFLHFSNNSVTSGCTKSTCIENSVITAYATDPGSYEFYQWDIDCLPSEEPYITNVIKSGEKFPDAQDPNIVYMIRNEHLINNDVFALAGTSDELSCFVEFNGDEAFIFHNSVCSKIRKPKDATTLSLITFVDANGNALVYYKWDNDISYSYRICYIGKIDCPMGSVRRRYEVLAIHHDNRFEGLARDLIPFGFAPSLEGMNVLSILDVTALTDFEGFEENENGLTINSYCNYAGIYFCEPGDKLHTVIISINGTEQESATEMIHTGYNNIWAATDPIEYFDKVPFDTICDTVYDGDLDILIDGHSPEYTIIDYNYVASLRRKDRIVYDRNKKPINYYCEQYWGSPDNKFYLVDTNGNIRPAINTDEAYIVLKYYL